MCYNTSCNDEREKNKMNKALDVARYIINTSNDKKYFITNLRLQKNFIFCSNGIYSSRQGMF